MLSVTLERRRMTSLADRRRTSNGFRLISIRPALSVALAPSTPMKEDNDSTAGSFRMASASACWCCAMAAKDVDCEASVIAWIWPVSCTGKNPLGTTRYSNPVNTRVTANTSSVRACLSSTQLSMRPYSAIVLSKVLPTVRYRRPWLSSGVCLSRRAHIMGVSVSDTKAEIKIDTASVIANSWNNRPTTSPMNNNGISTAISEMVSEMMVKPICLEPLKAAASGASPAST